MRRLRLPRGLSIRSRLILFLALSVLLTALAISLVTTFLGSRDARSRIEGQLSSVSALKRQEIRSWTNGLKSNLDIVLSETGIADDLRRLTLPDSPADLRRESYSRIQSQFLWAAIRMRFFDEIFFMDREGVVLISTVSANEGQRLGLNDFFVRGLADAHVEQPSYSLSLGKMTIVASAPVSDTQGLVGVIAGRADLRGLNQIMIERAGLGDTGETYLVGSNYRLLTYLRRPGYSIPETYVRTPGTDAAVERGESGSATYAGYAGTKVIGVYTWIPELQVALMAEQEEAEALGPTRRTLYLIGGLAALAAVLAILSGVALTHRIVRPLADLGDTAALIAGGRLEVEAPVARDDEIGALATAFNRMTAQLRELVRNLERRTDHLRAINESGRQISSILDLDVLLPHVAESLVRTFDYQAVRILLVTDGAGGVLHSCGRDERYCTGPTPLDLAADAPECPPALAAVARDGEEVLVDGAGGGAAEVVSEPSGVEDHSRESRSAGQLPAQPRAYVEIAVPIRAKTELVGVLDIIAREGHPLDEQDLFAARTLADQLAIAVENSRLYQHASELAAGRERQRLARDLHDAVSQTLFSVGLIAEVLPRIYERDPEQGRARLEEMRQLTRGALAEMRTLLLELRPAALAESKLPDLLRQLAEAVVGRARIPVEVVTSGECDELPPEVTVALYRIAQEALNNVAKHSGAARAEVSLACGAEGVELVVQDDGRGFDPAAAGAGQLGLGIMRERAGLVGAHLEVASSPGRGTTVQAVWTAPA